ncbi:hypothetical protein EVAR_3356_1 [Eumeta japonica]|uniref:Uncharacterized protein n=1 Tax=Eumeta variegata TaxID=151549 RepID=A0A4C1SVC3_EUMVA|nr:hypothetical protein EVAR_3356_1 [Eumeta japonica]
MCPKPTSLHEKVGEAIRGDDDKTRNDNHNKKWPPLSGSSTVVCYGSDHGDGGVPGAKKHFDNFLDNSTWPLQRTYFGSAELKKAVENGHIIGLEELRRQGDGTINLQFDNLPPERQ